MLLPIAHFITSPIANDQDHVTYWYEGKCHQTGEWLRLPRTCLVEAIAQKLMQQLPQQLPQLLPTDFLQEGKMFGILLVTNASGEQFILKAFSGLLNGRSEVAGWVPPMPGRDRIALEEAHTLSQLDTIQQELIALQNIPERQQYLIQKQEFETRWHQLKLEHDQRKQERQQKRQFLTQTLTGEALIVALEQLDQQSRLEGIARRHLKQNRDAIVQPLQMIVEQADARILELKRQRKAISRQLQTQLNAAYHLTNFAGETFPLQQLLPNGLPTGTGDCCAPKLLHYAATHHLTPIAMAEFWWGAPSPQGDKLPGQFYGACVERCQPLMGFLLSGLSSQQFNPLSDSDRPLPILYQDDWLIAINKPAGLLSVPGRYRDRQDSVLTRLQQELNATRLFPAHRLDQDTSGILLIARDLQTYRHLSEQFQTRQIYKCYEALLAGQVIPDRGTIALPLWADPTDRPYQKVDWQRGKPSLTEFRVIGRSDRFTRIEFVPLTGRTHQLRVHAAHPEGLGIAIWGDRLYGTTDGARLHLHAKEIKFTHPHTLKPLHLTTETPFYSNRRASLG